MGIKIMRTVLGINVWSDGSVQFAKFSSFFLLFLFMTAMGAFGLQGTSQKDSLKYLASNNKAEAHYRNQILDKNISVDFENVPLSAAVMVVARKAELKLVFSSDLIPDDKRVTMHKTNVSVEKAMWTLLKDTGLRFAISSKKHLVLMKREKVQEAEQNYIQETGIIIGTVFNAETGEPLPGASVYLEDTT